MKRATLGWALGLAASLASAQQVWRCEQDGQVRYTDQPCEKTGRLLPAPRLKVNRADGLATEAARAAPPASAASEAAPEAAQAPASAASVPAGEAMAAQPPIAQAAPPNTRRAYRGRHVMRVALQGLMDTDFVQRGYVPRRQNPAITPNP